MSLCHWIASMKQTQWKITMNNPRIQVITPTIGTQYLQQAIDSVYNQTIKTEHIIVADGGFNAELKLYPNAKMVMLPENTGANGWNGHRIYATMPLLSNADYILFLDEDNWFEPDHVEKMINFIKEHDLTWCYSLRKIVDTDGNYVADDNCDSLGKWPPVDSVAKRYVDTNCYCFKRKYLARFAHHFYTNSYYADRDFFEGIATNLPDYECNGEYSVNYRMRDRLIKIITNNNKVTLDRYNGNYPWTQLRTTK